MSLGTLLGSTSTTTQSQNTAKTTPGFLQPLQDQTASSLQSTIANPAASLQPIEAPALQQIKSNFAGAGQALSDRFLASGGGGAPSPTAATDTALGYTQATAGLRGQFATMALNQQNNAQSLSQKLLQAESGSSSNGTSTQQTSGFGSLLGSLTSLGLDAAFL